MKVPVRRRDSGIRFNITPLIDICFNLIVFFGLASLYVSKESAEQVALPSAGQSDRNATAAPRRLVVTMDARRRIFIGGEEIDRGDVERRIVDRCGTDPANFELRIRADKSIPFADVKPLVLVCARHGVANLKFAVETP